MLVLAVLLLSGLSIYIFLNPPSIHHQVQYTNQDHFEDLEDYNLEAMISSQK